MNEPLVSKRPGWCLVVSREFLVIDVRNGLKVEVHRGVYRHEGKGGHAVCEETPVVTGPRAIGRAEYRAQTLEEHHDSDLRVSTDRRGRGRDGRTMEDSADEEPGEISLLHEVEPVRDLRGVGVGAWWTKAFSNCESTRLRRLRQCLVPLSPEIRIIARRPSTVLDGGNKGYWEEVAAGFVTSVFLLGKHGLTQSKRLEV